MNDKTQEQLVRIIESLFLIHKKSDICQKKESFRENRVVLQTLYNIVKEKYGNKLALSDKLQKLIQFCQNAEKDEVSSNVYSQLLEETLAHVESEQFDKIKVLFLPYKASMWDSMESIYLAAKQNTDCQVDVMPVPYYSVNPQREIIGMEYEGDLFSKELQIIDYKTYDLADEKPDVVFIHNPYDEQNKVTQIHPDYFSENLKKYTSHLCYVPYDIAIEETFNENLCKMPGVQNAWRVFVQSKNLKQKYQKYMAEEKVVCLGSPKVDSMVKGLFYKEDVPEDWEKKCNGKLVLFLNTHLSRLMKADKLDLVFFKNLISYMRENDNVAIIWRPHPLILQTIRATNSMVLEEFQKIVEEFKALPNAIYDDTADMHNAIELSDAYFGDGGSVFALYGATGKPIYLCGGMNDVLEFESGFSTIRINQGSSSDWAFGKGHNGLYRVDFETKEASYELCLFNENFYAKQLYVDIVEYKNWLYLLPNKAKDIVALDKQTQEITTIITSIGNRKYKYSSVIVRDKFLIVVPVCDNDKMIVIDMDTQSAKEVVLENLGEDNPNAMAYGIADAQDDKLYIPSRNQNKVLVYSQNEMYWQRLDNLEGGLWQCKADKEFLWVITRDGMHVYRCTYDFKEISRVDYGEIVNKGNIFHNFDRFFSKIIDTGIEIWLIPLKAKVFLKINKETLQYEAIELSDEVIQKCLDNGKGYFGQAIYKDGKIYISSYGNADFVTVDVMSGKMSVDSFVVKNEVVEELHHDNKQKAAFVPMDKVVYKYTECSFEYFTNIVEKESGEAREKRKKEMLAGVENMDGSAGQKIWEYVYSKIDL